MKHLEPTPKKVVKRGTDSLGQYWEVSYEWELDMEKFSFGGPRMLEDLTPESEYIDEISEVAFGWVYYIISSQCAQVK